MRFRSIIAAASAVFLFAAGALLGGCGDENDSMGGSPRDATLVLDFIPGPVHAGVYRAQEAGYYTDAGIDLRIIEPTSTADTLRLIGAGRADFGLADGIDVAGQIDAGRDIQGILAITQRPLGGLITLRSARIESPAQLEGRRVGVTGVPSDDVVVKTIVDGAGGDPAAVEKVTIGFGGVQSLAAGKVDAFTGFIATDAVQVELNGEPTRSFPVDRFGGPAYPGLVAFSTREMIAADPELAEDFVAATAHGYEDVIAEPLLGVDALLSINPEIPRDFATRSLQAHLPLFQAGAPRFGVFSEQRLRELSRFLVAEGLAAEPITPQRYATNRFLP